MRLHRRRSERERPLSVGGRFSLFARVAVARQEGRHYRLA